MSATDPVLETMREIVAEVLQREVEEVHPADRLEHDLGAESVDLLEILWASEKKFRIKLSPRSLFPESAIVTDQNGTLTPESLAAMRRELPFLDFDRLGERPGRERLLELVTVEALVHFVKRAMAEKEAGLNGAFTTA